jgi:hypothetical protein
MHWTTTTVKWRPSDIRIIQRSTRVPHTIKPQPKMLQLNPRCIPRLIGRLDSRLTSIGGKGDESDQVAINI